MRLRDLPRLLCPLALTGCLSSVAGEWSGVCAFTSRGYEAEMDVFADVWTDNGYALEGEMTISDWNGVVRAGSMRGSHTGRYVSLVGSFLSELGYYEMEIDAEKSGGSMDGECAFRVPEGTGALEGEVDLER